MIRNTLQAIRLSLRDYCGVSQQVADFKAKLEAWVSREPHLPGLEFIKELKQDPYVKLLYLEGVVRGLAIVFWLLRDSIGMKGFEYIQRPSSNRSIYEIAFSYFENRECSKYAFQSLSALQAVVLIAVQMPHVMFPLQLSIDVANEKKHLDFPSTSFRVSRKVTSLLNRLEKIFTNNHEPMRKYALNTTFHQSRNVNTYIICSVSKH